MNSTEQIDAMAVHRAGEEHRRAGGTGAPSAELVTKHAAIIIRELANESTERGVRQSSGMRPLNGELPDDRPVRAEHRFMTGLDGRQHRAFGKGESLIDAVTDRRGLNLADVGRGLCGVISGHPTRGRDELRAMSTGYNPGGGLLITEEVSALIIDAARSRSRLFQLGADTVSMETEVLRVARLDTDPTVAVIGENAEITPSDAVFSAINLHARKLASLCYMSRELAEDAANAPEIVINSLTTAIADALDSLALNGNGGSDGWRGLMTSEVVDSTPSVGAITYDDILDAINELDTLNADGPYAMLAHPDTLKALRKLRDVPTGSYLQPPAAIAGMQLLSTTKLVNTHAVVGQFDQLLFGIRSGLQIEVSNEAGDAFKKHQVALKATLRGDSNLKRAWFHILDDLTY